MWVWPRWRSPSWGPYRHPVRWCRWWGSFCTVSCLRTPTRSPPGSSTWPSPGSRMERAWWFRSTPPRKSSLRQGGGTCVWGRGLWAGPGIRAGPVGGAGGRGWKWEQAGELGPKRRGWSCFFDRPLVRSTCLPHFLLFSASQVLPSLRAPAIRLSVRQAVKRDGHRETPKTNRTWSPSCTWALRVPPVLPLPCPLLWSCSFSEARLHYQQRSCGSRRPGLQDFPAELLPVCGNGLPSPSLFLWSLIKTIALSWNGKRALMVHFSKLINII